MSHLVLRQILLLLGSLAIGLVAGRAATESTTAAVVVVPISLALVICVGWWSGARLRDRLRLLREYVADWRAGLNGVSPALARTDEISELRDELDRTSQHLRAREAELRQEFTHLQRDAALLRSILGTMVEGVLVLDGETRLMYMNPAARKLLALRRREVDGLLLQELTRSSALQSVVEAVRRHAAGQSAEIELTREARTLAVSGLPLPSERGTGLVLVLHDITELRRLEGLRRDFVSNVSHELKTPLTSIQAYADSLLEGGLDDPGINRNFVERIVEQSERLRELILDIISLAQIESQQELLDRQPCSLNELVEEGLRTHQGPARAGGLELRPEVPDAPVVLSADHEALRTILDNLVSNAIRYTPAGGVVTIRLATTADEARLEVEDTGIGIGAEHRERVFERFYRVDKARSREVGGTGLGLSIVKHLVGLLGGRVELESEQGRGSRFRVSLPLGSGDGSSSGLHTVQTFMDS
jgi:two-component system phosphate regulon sensor histidine kinase PhoR